MLKRRPELYLVNIMISIDRIKRHTKNLSYQEFISDETIFSLIIRNLQEIGESVRKLIDLYNLEKKFPNKNNWRKIVDFRNVVVHKYFGTEPEIIFAVANEEVPILEKQMLDILKTIDEKPYLLQAIEMTIPIYSKMNRHETVNYLEILSKKLK